MDCRDCGSDRVVAPEFYVEPGEVVQMECLDCGAEFSATQYEDEFGPQEDWKCLWIRRDGPGYRLVYRQLEDGAPGTDYAVGVGADLEEITFEPREPQVDTQFLRMHALAAVRDCTCYLDSVP